MMYGLNWSWRPLSGLLLLGAIALCQGPLHAEDTHSPYVIDDAEIVKDFNKGVAALFKENPEPTPHAELVKQLERSHCDVKLPLAGQCVCSPEELYRKCLDTVLVVGLIHHCRSKTCKKNHTSLTTGVVLRSDGVVATNYHVVDSKRDNRIAMAVMTLGKNMFFVDEVLAADKNNDLAVLKLKDATGLSAAPVFRDEPVGKPVTVISHPKGMFYTLSQGYVARYCTQKGRSIMNVTADYARGSSGGPIFNNRGDVVGLVSSTMSLAAINVPVAFDENKALMAAGKKRKPAMIEGKPMVLNMNHQMTVKTTVPSRAILNLLKSEPAE